MTRYFDQQRRNGSNQIYVRRAITLDGKVLKSRQFGICGTKDLECGRFGEQKRREECGLFQSYRIALDRIRLKIEVSFEIGITKPSK